MLMIQTRMNGVSGKMDWSKQHLNTSLCGAFAGHGSCQYSWNWMAAFNTSFIITYVHRAKNSLGRLRLNPFRMGGANPMPMIGGIILKLRTINCWSPCE